MNVFCSIWKQDYHGIPLLFIVVSLTCTYSKWPSTHCCACPVWKAQILRDLDTPLHYSNPYTCRCLWKIIVLVSSSLVTRLHVHKLFAGEHQMLQHWVRVGPGGQGAFCLPCIFIVSVCCLTTLFVVSTNPFADVFITCRLSVYQALSLQLERAWISGYQLIHLYICSHCSNRYMLLPQDDVYCITHVDDEMH